MEPSFQVSSIEFLGERCPIPRALFHSSFKVLVYSSNPGSPAGPLWIEIPVCRAFLYTYPRVLSKEPPPSVSPHSAPAERDTPLLAGMERDTHILSLFHITFIHLSKSPVHEPPSRFLNGLLWEEMPVTRAFLYITFRVPNKEVPSSSGSPNRAPIERNAQFPEICN
jgi:hypothetical protein